MPIRPLRLTLPVLAAVLLCTSCTVPRRGIVGLERVQDGSLVARVEMCEGHVDSVIVYDTGGFNGKTVGTWDFADRVTGSGAVTLTSLEAELRSDVEQYRMYAASDDNSSSARSVSFTASTVASLPNGAILAVDYSSDDRQATILDDAGFTESATAYCDQSS